MGRPRKNVTEHQPVKKGRGRPRKVTVAKPQAPSISSDVSQLAVAMKELTKATMLPFMYVGMDQRSTKNLGNYETFVYGFSLTVPIPFLPDDNIKSETTKVRLSEAYDGISNFISDLMRRVEGQIDLARNLQAVSPQAAATSNEQKPTEPPAETKAEPTSTAPPVSASDPSASKF